MIRVFIVIACLLIGIFYFNAPEKKLDSSFFFSYMSTTIDGRFSEKEKLLEVGKNFVDHQKSQVAGFETWSDLSNDKLTILSAGLADFRVKYFKRYGFNVPDKNMKVFIFADREKFRSFANLVCKSCRHTNMEGFTTGSIIAVNAADKKLDMIFLTLAHEFAHYLNSTIFVRKLPPWLEEGIAVDFSQYMLAKFRNINGVPGIVRKTGKNDFIVEGPLAAIFVLKREMEKGELSLNDMLMLDWIGFDMSEKRDLLYSQAGFFVSFMLANESRRTFFLQLLEEIQGLKQFPEPVEIKEKITERFPKIETIFKDFLYIEAAREEIALQEKVGPFIWNKE